MSNQQQYPPPAQQQRPGNPNQRTLLIALVAVAAVLVVVLVVLVAVGLSSGSDSENASADSAGNSEMLGPPAPPASEPALDENGLLVCFRGDTEDLDDARWSKTAEMQPFQALLLTDQYPLPASHASLADLEFFPGGGSTVFENYLQQGITQFQDQTIGVTALSGQDNDSAVLAVLSQDGELVGQYDASNADSAPPKFDLVEPGTSGNYYRVEEATEGVQIPAASAGTEANMHYALMILPDAFDDERFWVLMRGSSDLYKAELYGSQKWREPGDSLGDLSQCQQ